MNDWLKQYSQFPWCTYGELELATNISKKIEQQTEDAKLFKNRPIFSIGVEVTSEAELKEFLKSMTAQSYPHWEVVAAIEGLIPKEKLPNVTWISVTKSLGAAARGNLIAKSAKGEWLGFLSASDILAPHALFSFARTLQKRRPASVLYCNEAQVDGKRRRISKTWRKPPFSWFTLAHQNYVGRAWFVNRELFTSLRGFRETHQPNHEMDLLLRLGNHTDAFILEPSVLLYRQNLEIPTPNEASCEVLKAHLQERRFPAQVSIRDGAVKIHPTTSGKVSVIVCFKDRADLTTKAIEGLARQKCTMPVEVILVDNRSSSDEISKVKSALSKFPHPHKLVSYDAAFNFAAMNTWAIENHTTPGSLVCLMNNDVHLTEEGTLQELGAWAALPWVGTVGLRLSYPKGGVQHGGVGGRLDADGRVAIVHLNDDEFSKKCREVFASTFALSVFKRETFDKVGGLRPFDYPNAVGDVAFSFECRALGLKNLYLGTSRAEHWESASRGANYERWEMESLNNEYPAMLRAMITEDFVIETPTQKVVRERVFEGVSGSVVKVAKGSTALEAMIRRFPKLNAILTHRA